MNCCYRPQTKFAKVMFLHVFVILFTRGVGIPACIAGLQAHTRGENEGSGLGGVLRPTPRGKVERSGLGGLQAHTQRGIPACTEGNTPQQTATAAGSTHPTGMHSCFRFYLAYGYMLVFMGIGFVSGAPIAGKVPK